MSASITSGTYPRAARFSIRTINPGSLRSFSAGLWRALCQAGAHRAHHELMQMARAKDHTDPALARQLRDAAQFLLMG